MARLTNIVTRTGDDGTTGLAGGGRVSKDSSRVWAYGTVDELNSAIGVVRSVNTDPNLDARLRDIQNDLFNLGGELATPPDKFQKGMPQIDRQQVIDLEKQVEDLTKELGPLQEFILPGGGPVGAQLHVARTICRRAERFCVRLSKDEKVGEFVTPYLNRLSDLLFTLARWSNQKAGAKETYWKKK
jgi:cob(I)alamin adenosyltransferase